jgi:hypothetical protein
MAPTGANVVGSIEITPVTDRCWIACNRKRCLLLLNGLSEPLVATLLDLNGRL